MSAQPFADAVVVAAGSSRRMGGIDKLQATSTAGPLLRLVGRARCARPLACGDVHRRDRRRTGSTSSRREPGCGRRRAGRRGRCAAPGLASPRGCAPPTRTVVLVHDGARPLVTPALVDAVAAAAATQGAAIPVLAVADSLKRVEGDRIAGAAPRDGIGRAQTPQGARRELLLAAVDAFADGPETVRRRGGAAGPRRDRGGGRAGRGGQPQGHARRRPRPRARARGAAGPPAPRYAHRHRQPPVRARRWPAPGRHRASPRRPACTATPTATPRSTPSATRCWRRRGMGDLGRAVPGGRPGDPRHRQPRAAARASWRGSRAPGIAPVSVDLTITGARPRLGGARLDRMRAAIAGLPGLPSRPPSRSRPRPATCRATRAPAGPSPRPRLVGVVTPMSLRFRNTLGGALEPFEPLRAGPRPHVQLRADGLRARRTSATSAASSSPT